MRITLLLCLFIQFVFSFSVNNETTMTMPHIKSLTANSLTSPKTSLWSLERMLSFYPDHSVQNDSLKVYPNPINQKDMLNISMVEEGKKRLTFYDITGKMVKVIETERKSLAFSISDIGTGVYILNVSSVNFQTTKKVIVK